MTEQDNQVPKQERSTFIYKDLESELLGREIYADDLGTPYSFYLVRKLILGKDYQSLAEGELFFDVFCEDWDTSEAFDELFVKKIYLHVETQSMTYTLLIGSFEPTSRATRSSLKQWLEAIQVENPIQPETGTVKSTDLNINIQSMAKQMMETSNELFRLRQMISELTETVNRQMNEHHAFKERPIISRSIKTIHLKRAQPLLTAESHYQKLDTAQSVQTTDQSSNNDSYSNNFSGAQKQAQDGPFRDKPNDKVQSVQAGVKKRRWVLAEHKNQRMLQPLLWDRFVEQLSAKPSQSIQPHLADSKETDETIEQQIYQSFVTTSKRLGGKKKGMKKQSILRTELLKQISQAEYLPYSWGEVLRYKQEDLLISHRLSTSNLVAGLDEFLDEMRALAYSRSLFGKKVRCSENALKRLTGYVLLNQYMNNLVAVYENQEKQNT